MPRLACNNLRLGSNSCLIITGSGGVLNEGSPWWNCGADLRNGWGWNALWFAIDWTRSCDEGTSR